MQGDKAVQELTRQLVDLPRARLPPLPTPLPTRAELEPLLGCYALQGNMETTLQVQWQSHASTSDISVTLNVSGANGYGSASLIPFPSDHQASAYVGATLTASSSSAIMPLALALRGNDTVVVRPKGVSGAKIAGGGTPLQDADLEYDRRELLFAAPRLSATSKSAQLAHNLVLHINGWDLFATRTSCK